MAIFYSSCGERIQRFNGSDMAVVLPGRTALKERHENRLQLPVNSPDRLEQSLRQFESVAAVDAIGPYFAPRSGALSFRDKPEADPERQVDEEMMSAAWCLRSSDGQEPQYSMIQRSAAAILSGPSSESFWGAGTKPDRRCK